MQKNLYRILRMGLILTLLLSMTLPVFAQTPTWSIRVSMVSTLEKPDEMNLKVYFSLYDPKTGIPVTDFKSTGSSLSLPQTLFTSSTAITKPDVPIYIVLVLDASGSMGGAADNLKKAAKLALNNTPDNSVFSVVQFNEDIKLIQDFTQNIPAVSYAVDQYAVGANKGTCLYDAAYSSVEALQKAPPGRRAIILFTDGKDERPDGKVCSKHSFMELSDFAQKAQIPISTIGLSYKEGAINEVELKGLAASTGGYSAIASQVDMNTAFANIMNGLKAQYMVEASVYPKKGTNQVVMTLDLKDHESLSSTFSIESNIDYPGPPSPVMARFNGLQFKPQDLTYDIQLSSTSPEMVDYVKVEVWDVKGGNKISEKQFTNVVQNNTFNIPTDQLVVGRDYELRMTAVSKLDQTRFPWAALDDGKKVQELVHPFVFDPTTTLPSLEIQSVSQQNNDLVLAVKTSNTSLIGGYDGWLVDEVTNTQVPNSNFVIPLSSSTGGSLTIPLSKLKIPDGKYTAVVRVLGKDSQVYSTAEYKEITYAAKLPNFGQLIYAALIAAPLLVFLIVLIILGLVGFLMINSNREKSLTGTPVLQGRLGGSLPKGQSQAPYIPIASEEPIPDRPVQPAAQPRASVPPVQAAPVQPRPAAQPVQAAPVQPRPAAQAPAADAGSTIIAPLPAAENSSATLISSVAAMPRAMLSLAAPAGLQGVQQQTLITQFPFLLGRTEGSLLIVEGNVSRKHAQITYNPANGVFSITDLNSSNGTFVNGQKITSGQSVILQNGSLIGLGPIVIFRLDIA
ncbi:MAG: FHA domain-containing protein [Chloroflexota bacterium]